MKKLLSLVLSFVMLFSATTSVFASTVNINDKNFMISNLNENKNAVSFDMINKDISVNYDIKKLDQNKVQIKTICTLKGGIIERHTGIYDKNNSTFKIDGRTIEIKQRTFTQPQEARTMTAYSTSWKYLSSQSLSFSDTVTTIGIVVTIVGGIIAGAAILGVSIAKSVIASAIGNWASVIGLGSLTAGYLLDGNIVYDLYQTTSQIDTGYGSKQIGYRYQNIGTNFGLKGKQFNETFQSVGSTWFATKPY